MWPRGSLHPPTDPKVAGLPGWAFNEVAARTKEMKILDADSASVSMEMLVLLGTDVGRRDKQFGDPLPEIKN